VLPKEQQQQHFPLELAMPTNLPLHAIRENLKVERLKTRSPHQANDEWEVGAQPCRTGFTRLIVFFAEDNRYRPNLQNIANQKYDSTHFLAIGYVTIGRNTKRSV